MKRQLSSSDIPAYRAPRTSDEETVSYRSEDEEQEPSGQEDVQADVDLDDPAVYLVRTVLNC